jgi:hypothetical protein
LIAIIVEMKRRNPRFGYQRIADQISSVFDIYVDKDVVRRVLAQHYRPQGGSNGPSWLTFLGHSKDSLWSVDLFRCESMRYPDYGGHGKKSYRLLGPVSLRSPVTTPRTPKIDWSL